MKQNSGKPTSRLAIMSTKATTLNKTVLKRSLHADNGTNPVQLRRLTLRSFKNPKRAARAMTWPKAEALASSEQETAPPGSCHLARGIATVNARQTNQIWTPVQWLQRRTIDDQVLFITQQVEATQFAPTLMSRNGRASTRKVW